MASQADPQPPAVASPDQRFRGLLESAPDAIVIVDESGTIQIVNGQAEKLFGYEREQLIGQKVDILVPTELRETHAEHRRHYVADPRTRPMGIGMDLVAQRKDSSRFPVEISLSPLQTEEGMLVTSVVRDITDRRRVEEAEREAIEARAELKTERVESEMRREVLRRSIAAQEEERRRIARELHDETAQALTGVLLGLGRIESAGDLSAASEEARRMGEELTDALRELRGIAMRLRPTILDHFGLVPALEQLVEQSGAGDEAQMRFEHSLERRLDPEVETTVYRVVQEALNNAAKHAEASEIRVEVRDRDGAVSAAIEDDGRGFDAEVARREGLGITGMEERAELIGGELAIASSPGAGTRVVLRVPVERA